MIIKSPPAPLFQRGESTQKSLMRHYYMLGVPIKKPDAPNYYAKNGGAEGDRTLGLHVANVALSQLSYCPISCYKALKRSLIKLQQVGLFICYP